MPKSPLPGRIGEHIKHRLESAAVRIKQLDSWEDLRRYILQDDKWDWDQEILLDWQQDITAHFLECCKSYDVSEDSINAFTLALADGQQLEEHTEANEAGEVVEVSSDHGTITQPEYPGLIAKPDRIIFVVRGWGPKNCDGLTVRYTDAPMSRISDKIVRDRWELLEDIEETLVGPGSTGRMTSVINLTWELPTKDGGKKSHTTTFEVVADHTIESDAEFGQNRFHSVYNRRKGKGHSVTKSLSADATPSKLRRLSGAHSQAGESSTSSSHRRQTAPSTSGRSGSMGKEEFMQRTLVSGLLVSAEIKWEKEQARLRAEEEDDDDFILESRINRHSSPNTSVSSDKSAHGRRRKKGDSTLMANRFG